MHAIELSRRWAWLGIAAFLSLSSAAAAQRFHARFDPPAVADGPVQIFSNGFESGGVCDWISTSACTLYIVTIPLGADIGDHGFPPHIYLEIGAVLHIVNGDTTPHRIHANGSSGVGLQHQTSDMTQGQEYVGTVTQVGQDVLYCHDHGTGSGTMTVHVP